MASTRNLNAMPDLGDLGDLGELVDYEEEVNIPVVAETGRKANVTSLATAVDGKDVKKGSYVSIHSTGFRDFLLKSELLRAISDCGFEHPSEGKWK